MRYRQSSPQIVHQRKFIHPGFGDASSTIVTDLNNPYAVAGVSLPTWVWVAGGAVALMLLMGKRR